MTIHYREHREGFPEGSTWICHSDDAEDPTGLSMGVVKLRAGEKLPMEFSRETALLLMKGTVSVDCERGLATLARGSLFDEAPSCVHGPAGSKLELHAETDTEFTLYCSDNEKSFPLRVYLPADVDAEDRGKGQIGDACWRVVRTIFGIEDGNENSDLVLGEVITLPGRWSSYPPHHHTQPEIYHYRFTRPQGFGHAELGEDVLKVKHGDTVKILDLKDHAQCAAPGYGMYYSWVIRHLEGDRYIAPEFTEEHRWVMEANAEYWQIKS